MAEVVVMTEEMMVMDSQEIIAEVREVLKQILHPHHQLKLVLPAHRTVIVKAAIVQTDIAKIQVS